MRFAAQIGVLAGDFASQQLAFAHLLDVCAEADFDQVEVIARPAIARLLGYFDAAVAAELDALPDRTLILLLPGANVSLAPTGRLRVVGRYAGHVTRALIPKE